MLTPFLEIISRIIKLLEIKDSKKRNWYTDVVDPIFSRFETVGPAYVVFFRKARDHARSLHDDGSSKEGLEIALSDLRLHREETLEARRLIVALVQINSIADAPEDVKLFLSEVGHFFHHIGVPVQGSMGLVVLDIFETVQDGNIPADGEWFRAFGPENMARNSMIIYGKETPLTMDYLETLLAEAVLCLEVNWKRVIVQYSKIQSVLPK